MIGGLRHVVRNMSRNLNSEPAPGGPQFTSQPLHHEMNLKLNPYMEYCLADKSEATGRGSENDTCSMKHEKVSTPDSDRGRLVSPLRVRHTGDDV